MDTHVMAMKSTENPNLEHGRGLKICRNPGLVMTTGAIETIFDIPPLAREIEEKPICSFVGEMVVFPQFFSSEVEI